MSRFSLLEVDVRGQGAIEAESVTPEPPRARHGPMEHARAAQRAYALGDVEVSLRAYSKALAEDPVNELAWVGQLFCLVDLGEYREARTWASRGLELTPQSAPIQALGAVALAREGLLADARRAIDAASAIRGAAPIVWWARGDVVLSVDLESASHIFDRFLEVRRRDWLAHLRVGRSYLSVGEVRRARSHLLRARNCSPDSALAWFCLGQCYERLGARGDSIESLERACELNRTNVDLATALDRARRRGRLMSLGRRATSLFARRGVSEA